MRRDLKTALLVLVPSLRAYAVCLTANRDKADDLVHSSLVDIWTLHRDEQSDALRVAAFSVLRVHFLRQAMAGPLAHQTGAQQADDADDFQARFARLPRTLREALSLTGMWGFTHEQAAEICTCDLTTLDRRIAMALRDLARPAVPAVAAKPVAFRRATRPAPVLPRRAQA